MIYEVSWLNQICTTNFTVAVKAERTIEPEETDVFSVSLWQHTQLVAFPAGEFFLSCSSVRLTTESPKHQTDNKHTEFAFGWTAALMQWQSTNKSNTVHNYPYVTPIQKKTTRYWIFIAVLCIETLVSVHTCFWIMSLPHLHQEEHSWLHLTAVLRRHNIYK